MRPDFGCGLRRYLMEPNTPATRAAIAREIEAALRAWEQRIVVGTVDVTPTDDPSTVLVSISYTLTRDQSIDAVQVDRPGRRDQRKVSDMTVPTPVLDDRSYDQILAELKARIPVYTPEWTDQGPSDPGITLLELFAYLGESLLYRFNQIPDQTRLWLLRLLQVPPYPPRRATGLVAFDGGQAAGDPPAVSQGTQVSAGSRALQGRQRRHGAAGHRHRGRQGGRQRAVGSDPAR